MVGRKRPPKGVYVLISRFCEYVTLHGKRDFAGVIKVKGPEMGRLFWIVQVTWVTWVLRSGRGRRVRQRKAAADYEGGEWRPWAKERDDRQKLEMSILSQLVRK